MMSARVGVVVTTYKRPQKLVRMVRSLLGQTYDDFEIMIVDDGSNTAHDALTESDLYTLAKVRGIDMRVAALEHNSGYLTKPRNIGYSLLDNELISYCDDDDALLPEHLQLHVEAMDANPDATVIYSRFRIVFDDGWTPDETVRLENGYEQPFVPFNHFQLMAGPMHNFINCYQTHRREHIARLFTDGRPWNEEIQRFGDWEFCIRAWGDGAKFVGVNAVTIEYFFHGQNLQLIRPCDENLRAVAPNTKIIRGERKAAEWRGLQSIRL